MTKKKNKKQIKTRYRIEMIKAKKSVSIINSKSHNRTERESKGVGRDILISKKLFLELCRASGKFPVSW